MSIRQKVQLFVLFEKVKEGGIGNGLIIEKNPKKIIQSGQSSPSVEYSIVL